MIKVLINGAAVEFDSVTDAQAVLGMGRAVREAPASRPLAPASGTAQPTGQRRKLVKRWNPGGPRSMGGLSTLKLDETHLLNGAKERTKNLISGLRFVYEANGPVSNRVVAKHIHRSTKGMAGFMLLLDNRLRGSAFARTDAIVMNKTIKHTWYIAGNKLGEVIDFLEKEIKSIED